LRRKLVFESGVSRLIPRGIPRRSRAAASENHADRESR
jgi:hypothetical protein